MRAGPYYQSIIVHNNAGPLGTAASLHASNGTLADEASADEELSTAKPFVPSSQPRLNALDGSVRDF